jgi:hypothetical protein
MTAEAARREGARNPERSGLIDLNTLYINDLPGIARAKSP